MTRRVVNKKAREIRKGDEIKLGRRWRRVTQVNYHVPNTDEEIQGMVDDVIAARDYSIERLTEAARNLASACLFRSKHPEPVVEISAASGVTSYYSQMWSPDAEFEVRLDA